MASRANDSISPAPRILPIPASQWDTPILDALGAFPAGLKFVLTTRQAGEECPRGAYVLGALAHHTALARAFLTFNAHVATASTLPARSRELAILRISWLKYSEYEFSQHLILGRRAGLGEEELERLQDSSKYAGWSQRDESLLRAVDDLHQRSRITPDVWNQLARHFELQQIMDLLFLVGCYATLAFALNSIDLPLEPGAPTLSTETRARLYENRAE